jgi:two-component system response regulator NreC
VDKFQQNMGEGMIRLLIVEDQAIVSKGMRMRLSAEPDLLVLAEASNSEDALELAISLCPDVVLIDVDMPEMDGIELANQLHEFCPQTSIIVLSMRDDWITHGRAAQAGAAALVGKYLPAETLLAQIRETCGTN